MDKSSSAHLLGCYIWMVSTLARGPLSREELDRKWARASVNNYKSDSIPESTFHRWRKLVEELFGITIRCNTFHEYYIEEATDIRNTDLHRRLLNLMSVNNILKDSDELRSQILFEPVPGGEEFLSPIIEGMRDKRAIEMTYQGFQSPAPSTFIVEPYCLKMFKQRWYMLARSPHIDELRVYALDRIHAIEPTKQKYVIADDCSAEQYFRHAYGVTVLKEEPERVTISISETQAPYLRTLPLHPSQKEIEPLNGYPTFTYYLYPVEEFQRELFAYGSDLEVHEPEWLRKVFADNAKNVNDMYNSLIN